MTTPTKTPARDSIVIPVWIVHQLGEPAVKARLRELHYDLTRAGIRGRQAKETAILALEAEAEARMDSAWGVQ